MMSADMQFLQFFIPLFVAIDALGMVPVFISMTDRLSDSLRRRIAFEATLWATLIALAFMLLGKWIFEFLSISPADFRIAGGTILLVYAIRELIYSPNPSDREAGETSSDTTMAVVPLAVPLIAGPATLTLILVLAQQSVARTALSLALNFGILLVLMLSATTIGKVVGFKTLRALSKLVMVLLAAIAVNFIRTGVVEIWREV